MTATDRHIIHRQIIELGVPDRANALRWQMQVSELYKTQVIRRLEQHFDKLGLDTATLRIPKLEIDLGVFSPRRFEQEFAERCYGAIETEVQRLLAQVDLTAMSETETESPSTAPQLVSGTVGQVVAWLHFLRAGVVPPPYHTFDWSALETMWSDVLAQLSTQQWQQLARTLHRHPAAAERLVKQFSEAFIRQLFLRGGAHFTAATKSTTQAPIPVAELVKQLALATGWSSQVWASLPVALLVGLHAELPSQDEKQAAAGQLSSLRTQVHLSIRLVGAFAQYDMPQRLSSTTAPGAAYTDQHSVAERAAAAATEMSAPAEPAAEESNPTQPVQGAGIVILHPFLPALFRQLGWLVAAKWIDQTRQERALHLLQYLVWGTEQTGEHEMTLAKHLCGWPPNSPVDRRIELTNEEKQEADELLQALVQHWTALKTTVPAAMQEGFLQRAGLLSKHERGWRLQVERLGQDILVDRLPWGIGMVRLAWLEEVFFVEW